MKKKLIFSILLASSMFSYGQNYIHLGNLSGVGYSNSQLQQLEVGASTLIDEFPATFQDSFRVYDFSLYHLMDYTQEGLSEIVVSIDPANLAQTKYYYIIIRVYFKDGTTKYYPFLKLPRSGIFECYTDVNWESLYSQLSSSLQPTGFEGITSSLAFLKIKIAEIAACCEPGTRNSCTLCLTSEEVENIFSTREGYIRSNSNVRYNNSLIYSNSNERSGEILIGDGKWIIDYIEQGTSIFEVVDYHLEQLTPMDLTFQAFVTSNDDICSVENKFEQIENEFKSSQADVILRIHLDNESGKIYECLRIDKILDYYDEQIAIFYDNLASELIANQRLDPLFMSGSRASCDANPNRVFMPTFIDETGATNCGYSLGQGVMAHTIIQSIAQVQAPIYGIDPYDVKLEYGIPKLLGGLKFADIVDVKNGEIYEIKSVCSWQKGVQEVQEYVELANDNCRYKINYNYFKKGKRMFGTLIDLPWGNTKNIRFGLHREKTDVKEGVITYRLIDKKLTKWVPDTPPMYVPYYGHKPAFDSQIKRIMDFLKEYVNAPNKREAGWQYLKDNIDLRPLIITLGTAGIIAFAVTGYYSGGSTYNLTAACGVLVFIALTFDPDNPPAPGT